MLIPTKIHEPTFNDAVIVPMSKDLTSVVLMLLIVGIIEVQECCDLQWNCS